MMDLTKEMKKPVKNTISLVLASAVCVASVFSAGAFSKKVDINVDDKTISTFTLNIDVPKILEEAGIVVSDEDVVENREEPCGTLKIDVKRAFDVEVSKNDETVCLKIAAGKVKDAINSSGLQIKETDVVNLPEDMDLKPGMQIRVLERVKINLSVDGETKELLAPKGTVNDALEFSKIPFSSEDIINVDVFSDVYEGMEVTLNRIIHREVTQTCKIPFNVVSKNTNLLHAGEKRIVSEGKEGEKEVKLRETLMDGHVIKSEEISSRIVSEPVDRVMLQGESVRSVSNPNVSRVTGSSPKETNVLVGCATAYTAPIGSRTSTGTIPKQGVTLAVNPQIIPYGKKVTIKSVNGAIIWSGVAQDTGGALKSGSALVDIYMNSRSDCVKFGRKKVKIYF